MAVTNHCIRLLSEIYLGDDGEEPRRGPHSLAGSEDGKIIFVTVIIIPFLFLLVALVVNVGRTTNRKIETQNAADAVAYSSALTMARGMNAITAANHVLGELTAIVVCVDAIGGVEFEDLQSNPKLNPESVQLSKKIATLGPLAGGNYSYLIGKVEDNAGGMLSDARLTLKYNAAVVLQCKIIAQILKLLPPTSAVGKSLDQLCAAALEKIKSEWDFLEQVERWNKQVLLPMRKLAQSLIPVVAEYPKSVVKNTNGAVALTVKEVAQANKASGALYPSPRFISSGQSVSLLPLVPEARPVEGDTAIRLKPRKNNVLLDVVRTLREVISLTRNPASRILNNLVFKFIKKMILDNVKGNGGKVLREIAKAFEPTDPESKQFNNSNPSLVQIHRNMPANYKAEEQSQWVRATYPWVCTWRRPFMTFMDFDPVPFGGLLGLLRWSAASHWYEEWTDRYTLVRSYQYRSGKAFGGEYREWREYPFPETVFMYVLKYQPDTPSGTGRDMNRHLKGKEPWTKLDVNGRSLGEQMFAVVAVAHREAHAIFPRRKQQGDSTSDKPVIPGLPREVFKEPPGGHLAFAQAMIYNANFAKGDRFPEGFQPNVGWDTLNWELPIVSNRAYQYRHNTQRDRTIGNLNRFIPFTTRGSANPPVIHLNWQAKLVPVTLLSRKGFREAILSQLHGDARDIFERYPRQKAFNKLLHNH